jgi:hypothetical protein
VPNDLSSVSAIVMVALAGLERTALEFIIIDLCRNNGKTSSGPWQVRNIDTGPEQALRAAESPDGTGQVSSELGKIVGGPIGQSLVCPVPDVLGRIELRGIGREVMDVHSGVAGERGRDFAAAVNASAIPQEIDRPAEVPEEILQEGADVEAAEVARLPPEV